jgi:hypothetical protein
VPLPVHLFNKKSIKEPIVAIDMKKSGTSTIQIGRYDPGRFRYKAEKPS